MPVRRILILSSSTGGGHNMRADALQNWIARLNGHQIKVRRWQALEESSGLDRFGVGLYNCIQKHIPRAHHIYFNFLEQASLHKNAGRLRGRRQLAAMIRKFSPDVVVSTHAHLNHGYFEAIRRTLHPKPVRCLTYCGELHGGYGFSKHWVNPQADGFIAAVPACAEAALALGMPESRIYMGGFLLDPQFYTDSESTDTQHPPPFVEEETTDSTDTFHTLPSPRILLGTGANGANKHRAILQQLRELKHPLSIIALCGHNTKALAELQAMRPGPHHLVPLGYRKDMAHLLRGVDLAFIRPGTGTTSECIRSACPILFNGIGGLMPQEGITLRYLRSIGLQPVVVRHPREFVPSLQQLLNPQSDNALELQRDCFRKVNADLSPAGIVEEVLR